MNALTPDVVLSDGIYLGLDESIYFKLHRLGSTDLSKLAKSPADWWYSSRYNPEREQAEPSYEMSFGKALHAYVLEGREAFEEAVSASPFDDFRSKGARDWRDDQIALGKIILTEREIKRVEHQSELIINHPEFSEGLKGGLSEVSVLFEIDGLPMRARLDKLLPRFVIDLKSFGGHLRGRDNRDKVMRIVAERDYDIQRYVYDRAREAMIDMIKSGRVHGATAEQLDWLNRLAGVEDWSWVWLFFQRRDDKAGKASVVMPIERPRFDVTFDTGRRKAATAFANYRHFAKTFGLDVPWVVIEPMWRPNDHDFPSWLSDVPEPFSDAHPEPTA